MLDIRFLNVGHGDCTMVLFPSGRLMMIDISNCKLLPDEDIEALAASVRARGQLFTKSWEDYYRSLLVDPYDYYVENFTGRSVFRHIQTHPDMDHMSGLARFYWFNKVGLSNFWDVENDKTIAESECTGSRFDYRDWQAYTLLRQGHGPDDTTHKVIHREPMDEGNFWTEDGVTILSPAPELAEWANKTESWNNLSSVLRLDYGGRRIILPGDAEKPTWDSIQANLGNDELRCDILKAAHHGRESGYSEDATSAMAPDLVICSVGKKPDTDASDEYATHGARVLSTRYHGTIRVRVWPDGSVRVDNHKGEEIDSLKPLQ